jgi:hypothetical protein
VGNTLLPAAGSAVGMPLCSHFSAPTFSCCRPPEQVWGPRPQFIREQRSPLGAPPQYDAVVCGGTLGIFLAAALQLRGLRVAVVERGPLLGRAQEWNISRKELADLVHLGVLSREEAEGCISMEFNPGAPLKRRCVCVWWGG